MTFFILLLFFIIGKTVISSYSIQENLLKDSLKNKALAIFNLVVDVRHWNSMYDGVYVKSKDIKPNPYLNPSFIMSENNETLIWVNPAFMTRQISQIANKREDFSLKITSNITINEDNAPTKIEKKILNYFEKNPNVPYYWQIEDNKFIFMGSLKTEQSCLTCHNKQGYQLGDVRGGISVTFDASKEYAQLDKINKDKLETILLLVLASIGTIVSFISYQNIKNKNERRIHKLNKNLEEKVTELDNLNKNLNIRVNEELNKQREKENLLIQQSKLAAVGEMIGNIAHQWRQPINAVNTIIMNIKWTAIAHGVDKDFLDERMKEADEQLCYMSHTIDDFRNFFKPDKEKELFSLKQNLLKACNIVKASLENNHIEIKTLIEDDIMLYTYSNELSQVVLNLLSNAKDILIMKEIKDPLIIINGYKDKNYIYCIVEDNAGGIEKEFQEKIFEPYFTTKKQNGTGIGLYISKEIITKHIEGTIDFENTQTGAKFIIKIPMDKVKK